jgi:hypothetical protein
MEMRGLVLLLVAAGCGGDVTSVVADGGESGGESGSGSGGEGEGSGASDGAGGDGGWGSDPSDGGADTSGSAGSDVPGCGNGVVDADEECDGTDLAGQTCNSLYEALGTLACNDDCTIDECECFFHGDGALYYLCATCGDGYVDDSEECDGWVRSPFGDACESYLGPGWSGDPDCSDDCTIDTTPCALCGDGIVGGAEACDGSEPVQACADLFGETAEGDVVCTDCEPDTSSCSYCGDGILDRGELCEDGIAPPSCVELGFFAGTSYCSDACTPEVVACHDCGNGVLDPGEACDGEDLGAQTCGDLGFGGGALACTESCAIDLSACTTCGNGILDAGEACDGAAGDEGCACTPACTLEGALCNPAALVISEILYRPLAAPEAKEGEWFEVHNPADEPAALLGCVVSGTVPMEAVTIDEALVIPAHGYATFGTGTEEDLGFVPDFSMPIASALLNGGDSIAISCAGVELDSVTYDDAAPWPVVSPGIAIAALELDPSANDSGAAWCAAPSVYGLGQTGTPGAANDCS